MQKCCMIKRGQDLRSGIQSTRNILKQRLREGWCFDSKTASFWINTASLLIFEQQKYHPTHQSRFCNGVRKNVYFCNSGFWHMGSSGSMANLFRCSLGLCTKKILKNPYLPILMFTQTDVCWPTSLYQVTKVNHE